MSFCMMCREHATFTHTVFQGTAATTVKLCDRCAASVGVEQHLASIKEAPDKEAKRQAVTEFLSAVEGDAPGAQI